MTSNSPNSNKKKVKATLPLPKGYKEICRWRKFGRWQVIIQGKQKAYYVTFYRNGRNYQPTHFSELF